MAQTAVATMTVNPYPKGLDKTQRRQRIQGVCVLGSAIEAETFAISHFAITSNVVTFTTASNTLDGTENVIISGIASPYGYLNGAYTLTSSSSTTAVAALTHANVTSTAITGTLAVVRYPAPIAITSFQVATDVITFQAANDLLGSETVTVSGFVSPYTYANGIYALSSATATTLVAPLTHADAGPITAPATAILTPQYATLGVPLNWNSTGLLDGTFGGPFLGNWGPAQTLPILAEFFSNGGMTTNPFYQYVYDTTNNTLRIATGGTELSSAGNISPDNIGFEAEYIMGGF